LSPLFPCFAPKIWTKRRKRKEKRREIRIIKKKEEAAEDEVSEKIVGTKYIELKCVVTSFGSHDERETHVYLFSRKKTC